MKRELQGEGTPRAPTRTNDNEALATAVTRAARTVANRRVVIAFIDGSTTRWWGGSIDDWQPDESRLSSRAALERYRRLVDAFRDARVPTAHAVMAYRDGSFASVMLGVSTSQAVESYMTEVTEMVRTRSVYPWLKA